MGFNLKLLHQTTQNSSFPGILLACHRGFRFIDLQFSPLWLSEDSDTPPDIETNALVRCATQNVLIKVRILLKLVGVSLLLGPTWRDRTHDIHQLF